MKKALLVTTVSGFIPQFEMNNVKLLQKLGYEVHYATNYNMPSYGYDNKRLDGTGIIQHQIDFVRSPFSINNIEVYKQLKTLMTEVKFDLVHCHTPMGGVMARLVSRRTMTAPVIYTAHGFHFFRGSPLVNWLVYYPVERWLSRFTDVLITITQEDYERAKNSFKAKKVVYLPGIGIDTKNYIENSINRSKNDIFSLPDNTFIILSVGELNGNKNHTTLIKTIAKLQNPNIYYVICGKGELEIELKNLAKNLCVSDQVKFLGYRSDIKEIYTHSDVFILPSFREGLSMALMEAMASGLPIICSDIRGNRDIVKMGRNGYLVKPDDIKAYKKYITMLYNNKELRFNMAAANKEDIINCDNKKVRSIMYDVYSNLGN